MLTRYGRLGASSRQRFLLFKEPLQRRGVPVVDEPLLSDAYLRRVYANRPVRRLQVLGRYFSRALTLLCSSRSSVVWLEKEALPWMPAWVELLLVGRRPLIVDFDDGWHLKYGAAALPREDRCGAWRLPLLARKLESLARRADVVFVANRALLRWALDTGARNVVHIPTVVDLDRYRMLDEPAGPFTIGWIGTPLNLRYLQPIAGALRRLSEQGARLLLIGAPPGFELPGIAVETAPWSEETEAEHIGRCHVGIMPLDDAPWERFKSGYKLIQYMAAGRAVVASPVGANLDVVRHDETGFLARSEDEWLEALAVLRDDPELRRRFGQAGRRRCAAHFSLNVALGRITEALSAWPGISAPPPGSVRRTAA